MRRPGQILLALGSGLLYAAAFPPFDVGELAFLALVPLLLVVLAPGMRARRRFLLGWLAGTVATSLLVTTSVVAAAERYFALSPGPAWLAGLLAPQLYGAPYFGLFALLAGAAVERCRGPAGAALAIAAAWTSCDFLRSQLGDGCPWVLLAHSQHAHPTLLQVADLGGAPAVSFLVALVNAAVVLALTALRTPLPGRRRVLARLALLLACVLGTSALYGRVQLARWSAPAGEPLRVAVVQGNLPDAWRYSLGAQPEALRRMQQLTAGIAAQAPDLVVWPENAISVAPDATSSDFAAAIRGAPAHVRLLVGAPRAGEAGPGRAALYNAAFAIGPDGALSPVYDKLRLTPWAEGAPWPLGALPGLWPVTPGAYSPGSVRALPDLRGQPYAVSICSEAIDAGLIRAQVRQGATFLVNIANDGWFGDRPAAAQHAGAALLRAVENRRALVRVTATGISQVVAPSGVVLGEVPAGVAGTLVATVTPQHATTVYTRAGDAFAWLCVLGLSAILARRATARTSARRRAPPRP